MQSITIVGAGQSGLLLGIGLRKAGYPVSIISNRTPEQIAKGRITSSQCMFHMARQIERRFGLDTGARECPPIDGIALVITDPEGNKAIDWAARFGSGQANAVDQRLKFPLWMQRFEELGGRLVFEDVGIPQLETYSAESDLVIVAAGKGEIAALFERDDARSAYRQPMRNVALTYVHGMLPRPEYSCVVFDILPGIGEYLVFPGLTHTGPCEIMVFEAMPGGPMDRFRDVKTPAEHLRTSKAILSDLIPWEAARCHQVELTDELGTLVGALTPTVRRPFAKLPSGRMVLGMGDVVCLNDPVTGQGANNATKCANAYYECITQNEGRAFDRDWMQSTFDAYWRHAKYATEFTNGILLPPEPHVQKVFAAAGTKASVATRVVDGFNDPRTFFPWFTSEAEANRFIAAP